MRYVSNRPSVEEQLSQKIRAQLVQKAVEYERIMQDMMREPKTGRIYGAEQGVNFVSAVPNASGAFPFRVVSFTANRGKVLGGKGSKGSGVHRASAPGEAPAIWFAFLTKGITHFVTQLDKMRWSVQVGVTAESGRAKIAKDLEFGTSRMQPRPMWRAALALLSGSSIGSGVDATGANVSGE